jgi:hypothetical protein
MQEAKSEQLVQAEPISPARLDIKAFAVTCGLMWGIGLFLLTWWVIAFEGGSGQPNLIGHVYRGYTISPLGSLIGFVWATPDALIGGAIFAWLYNLLGRWFSS